MSKMKLIALGLAGLGAIGTGVVGYLGFKKIKLQDEAIDRMVTTLEEANDMLINYEDTVKTQKETIEMFSDKIEKLEAENKRLRKSLNEKEAVLDALNYKDVHVDETTGEITFEENKEFEEMRKQGKGKTVPYNVFAQPIREQEIKPVSHDTYTNNVSESGTYTKKFENEPEKEEVKETVNNYSEFIHTNQDVTNVWDQYPSYDTEQGDISVETVEEEARRIEVSNKLMKEQTDKNGQEVLFAYFDMITFPYRNDAEFGFARGVQFANHYGIPFNDGDNEDHIKFDYNNFVAKLKSLFDYKLDFERINGNDMAIIDDLVAARKQFFGPNSIHCGIDQITLGEWIDYAIKRVGYDMYNFSWVVMMDYVMHSIGWYTDGLTEDDYNHIVYLLQHHTYYNEYYNSYSMFRLVKDIDQYWGNDNVEYYLRYSLRNEWTSFLSRVLNYEAEHEDD